MASENGTYVPLPSNPDLKTSDSDFWSKWLGSLKRRPVGRWIPEEGASFFSRITFWWVNGLISLGNHKALAPEDLWDVAENEKSENVTSILRGHWNAQVPNPNPSLGVALWSSFGFQFAMAGVLKFVHDVLQFMSPVFLNLIVNFLQKSDRSATEGLILALSLFISSILQTICIQSYFHIVFKASVKVRASVISLVYLKALKISSVSKQTTSLGEIVNLQSNDAEKLANLCIYLHIIWSGPLQIFGSLGLLFAVIGVIPALTGMLVMILLLPVGGILMSVSTAVRKRLIACTDSRVKLVTEVISGIRAVKLYAWEGAFKERITGLREKEIGEIRTTVLIDSFMYLLYYITPTVVSLASLGCFVSIGQIITPSVAFTSLALFNLLRFPLFMIPAQISSFAQAMVSLGRLEKFLLLPEIIPVESNGSSPPGTVEISNASFLWAVAEEPKQETDRDVETKETKLGFSLTDINLLLTPGKLLMVIGEVGSGKSSLLSALLGEMTRTSGACFLTGTVAYTSQDPWIQNASVRDNILMGREYDADKYERVLDVCALREDLSTLPQGDQAEIGEKGLNLSGGQKHRVALARAVYSDADIFLLDDPLSAVDTHVGRHLFEQCVCQHLSARTRILVTHQLQFVEAADAIAVVKEGRIVNLGTYQQLKDQGVDFEVFKEGKEKDDGKMEPNTQEQGETDTPVIEPVQEAEIEPEEGEEEIDSDEKKPLIQASGSHVLVKDETRAVGKVKGSVYLAYLRSWGPGMVMPALVFLVFVFAQGIKLGNDVWLTVWSQDGDSGSKLVFYLAIYAGTAVFSSLMSYCRSLILVQCSLSASRNLHKQLLERTLRLPMSFFDSQPTGRLLNRFTRDTEQVDIQLPDTVGSFLACLFQVVFSVGTIVYVTPLFAVPLFPVLWLYYSIQLTYIAASRELKRLDSVARSPIFAHCGETVQGLATIRAFGSEGEFATSSHAKVDASTRAYFASVASNRWLAMRLEVLGTMSVFATALLCVTNPTIEAGFAGLSLTNALTITAFFTWLVRMNADMETQMNSVERVLEYTNLPTEAPAIIDSSRPPKSWPSQGAIDAYSLVVRYRPDLDPVLNNLSFSVLGGEKVGICGRTGCGKSTLMLTLYRMLELEQGTILLDGLDISKLGLFDLRSRLALVPQDPVVFSGTIRLNLDPFQEASGDIQLWDALGKAGLKAAVEELPGKLDASVSEGGLNLSTGQRQLLCMARALLRHSKVLVLDEATSNVDGYTDALIQRTIREAFVDCTVLTIAHRLHTIIDSDRVLLLEKGQVAEFDSPSALLENRSSRFSGFVDQAMPKEASALRRVASQQKTGSTSKLV